MYYIYAIDIYYIYIYIYICSTIEKVYIMKAIIMKHLQFYIKQICHRCEVAMAIFLFFQHLRQSLLFSSFLYE